VPGDVIETGVLAGGATIFMRAILKANGDTTRESLFATALSRSPRLQRRDCVLCAQGGGFD